tara:strand:+ start:188 stop:724 length:537 start_codon:yes stop_codon:yes gene_type:complete
MGEFLMNYLNEIQRTMKFMANNRKTLFLGQSVKVPGNLIFKSLESVSKKQKIELPVFEDAQLGMSIGLSLSGYIPITCYPRFDFLLLAFNQLINHLDKMEQISSKEFKPFVIVRVLVGSKFPVDAGLQHTQNYSKELKSMMKFIDVINLNNEKKIFQGYKKYFNKKKSAVFIEYSNKY